MLGRFVACLVLLVCVGAHPAVAATRYDPRLRFRTIRTAHFEIYWHQGEEAPARRLAAIAERVRDRLQGELGTVNRRVHVILVDQSDLANGWATPVPYDAIELTLRPPAQQSSIGNTTDWLELVFTHEYTHILHLDRSRGLMAGVRRVFGRVPVAFPNLFLPQWQVEGMATFEESRQTGEGRVAAGDFRVLVDAAARAGRFEPRDRAAGGFDFWPSGDTPYAYGGYFHEYLADRYGAERLAALRDVSSGRVPFFGARAFRRVYGRSLSQLWDDFRAARASVPVHTSATDAAAVRLTRHGYDVSAPAASGTTLVYSLANADRYPALLRRDADGSVTRLAWRYGGEQTTVRGDWIVFDQVAPVRSVAWYSDLYAVPATGGRVTRLTRESRAAAPDLSPDGATIACTVEHAGVRLLATLPFDPSRQLTPRVVVSDDADYGAPRWSPDGTRIAAERRRAGVFELVVLDVGSGTVTPVLASSGRLMTPAWSSAGDELVFAAAVGGRTSNVFALRLADGRIRRLTDSVTGAREPHLSADGATLTYVGYTIGGYDLFTVPVRGDGIDVVDPSTFHAPPPDVAPDAAAREPAALTIEGYSPRPTLTPTYWTPVVYGDAGELNLGAGTGMSDVLGRHAYAVQAAWSTRPRPDWSVAYAYDRWRPTLFATYSDDTDPVRGGEVRSRELVAGTLLPFRRLRRLDELFAALDVEYDSLACDGGCRTRVTRSQRTAWRAGWLIDTRRAFPLSLGAEEGSSLAGALEFATPALGSDVSARALVADARGYHRVGAGHTTVALRGAVAAAFGALDDRRVFSAGGSGPAGGAFDFGRDAIGLLRGVDPEDVLGTRAAVINAELRVPLARPERGFGDVPLFLRTLHAAAFVDAGSAWDRAFRGADVVTSVGGECSIDLVAGHYLPLTISGGAAWTRRPGPRSSAAAFLRVGHAF